MKPSEVWEECIANIDLYEEHVRAWAYINIDGAREVARELITKSLVGLFLGYLLRSKIILIRLIC